MTFLERRRSPRSDVALGPELRQAVRTPVRLVDISASGALLAVDEGLPVGTTGRMRVTLGPGSFEAHVEVRRHETRPDAPLLLGTRIVSANPRDQDALDRFLQRALP